MLVLRRLWFRLGVPVLLMLLGAFALMTAACAWRVRADLWQDDNLVNGDRYFHISRVLVAWLVILEWRAPCRATASTSSAAMYGFSSRAGGWANVQYPHLSRHSIVSGMNTFGE